MEMPGWADFRMITAMNYMDRTPYKKLFLPFVLVTPLLVLSALSPGRSQTGRLPSATQYQPVLSEEFSFQMRNIAVRHQGGNLLNISVRYRYKPGITVAEYPDFVGVYRDVESFLKRYPNTSDYWEIVNKNATRRLLDKYPMLSRVSISMAVAPTARVPYPRASHVTRSR